MSPDQIIAAAELEGFIRKPSLEWGVHLEHDAAEALLWLRDRGLLAPNGLPWGDVPYDVA